MRLITCVARGAAIVAMAAGGVSATLHAQSGPPPAVRAVVNALEQVLGVDDDRPIESFVSTQFAPEYLASESMQRHVARIRAFRAPLGGKPSGVNLLRDADGLLLTVAGKKSVQLRLVLDDNYRITKLVLASDAAAKPARSVWADMTWENLSETFQKAEASGWSGVVLARRDGREVMRRALGMADQASARKTQLNTVFCIGSQPMDFTHTAILLLIQQGKLRLSDSIAAHFPAVPLDKRGITVQHLLDGQSGLSDFFDDSTDWDPDLKYIDRETAEQRMFRRPLEFLPGTERRRSHAAYGLLAALVERVSGVTYQEFLRTQLFVPLGMTRTGFYGESLGLSINDFAVGGKGGSSMGVPNMPPNWGRTSWLVMGSGGMMSTLDDMARYYAALEAGTLIKGDLAKRQQGLRMGAGGSDRGFFIFHATNGRGTSILYLKNGEGRSRENSDLTRSVQRLISQ